MHKFRLDYYAQTRVGLAFVKTGLGESKSNLVMLHYHARRQVVLAVIRMSAFVHGLQFKYFQDDL